MGGSEETMYARLHSALVMDARRWLEVKVLCPQLYSINVLCCQVRM